MTKEKEFINELIALMNKYKVEMYIEIDQDYAGVQGAELRFDTKDSFSNLVFSGWDRNVDADMIRAEANEA